MPYRDVISSYLTHIHFFPQTDPGHLETFQSLLRDNPCVFHACRTATSLHHHWVLMGHYNLLNNQKGSILGWKALIRVNGGGALLWYPFRFSQDNPVNEGINAELSEFPGTNEFPGTIGRLFPPKISASGTRTLFVQYTDQYTDWYTDRYTD